MQNQQANNNYKYMPLDQLRKMVQSLGILLMLNCPQSLEFGIDNMLWKVGNKFKGVKLIPLGTHIITYSLKSQAHMFKISQFINFTPNRRIYILKWNRNLQYFEKLGQNQEAGYKAGVEQFHFDSYLGAYPQHNISFWKSCTSYISEAVLHKLDPPNKLAIFANEYGAPPPQPPLVLDLDQPDPEDLSEQQEHAPTSNIQNAAKFHSLLDTINYSEIPRTLSNQSTTRLNMDTTPLLKHVLSKWDQTIALLGELQYAFAMFLVGEDLASFQQWKKLIHLIAFAEEFWKMIQGKEFVLEFLKVLYGQLQQFPQDFFMDELSKSSFLVGVLRRLHEYRVEREINNKVRKRLGRLEEMLRDQLNYQITQYMEDKEDMPVVIEQRDNYF